MTRGYDIAPSTTSRWSALLTWILGRLPALLRFLLLALALAGIVVTGLPYLQGDAWWIRYPDFPRVQFLAAMLLTAALLLLLPRRTWLSWCAALALAVACTADAVRLAPYVAPLLVPWPVPLVAAGSCPADARLRVFEANVQMSNQHDHRLLEMVRRLDPDIAWFQETDAWWEKELAPLGAAMPHGAAQAQQNYFGVHLFSKLPLRDVQIHQLTNSRNPSVFATATLRSGQDVKVYAIHPRPPQVGQSTAERDAQLIATALAAHGDSLAHVVLGDLNAVPWEDVISRAKAIGGFSDPRIGRGLYITWNAKHALLKWPLDHVLPGPGFTLGALTVLPAFGSDHLPLVADLCPGSGPAERQSLSPEDLAKAHAIVARGQGKAVGRDAATPPGAETRERDD